MDEDWDKIELDLRTWGEGEFWYIGLSGQTRWIASVRLEVWGDKIDNEAGLVGR